MKAHLIFIHPNVDSFNGALRNTAIRSLQEQDWEVSVSDLCQIQFKASADDKDFTKLSQPDYFDIQQEQFVALKNGTFTKDIKHEHQLLTQADLIIFQFPLWWYSMPALMKGYIDRVFSYGFAYGKDGVFLRGKHVLVSTSTGAPKAAWNSDQRGSIEDILHHLLIGTFGLCGLKVIPPAIAYGAKRMSSVDRQNYIDQYTKKIKAIAKEIRSSIKP